MDPLIVMCPAFPWGLDDIQRYLCLNYAHIPLDELLRIALHSCWADTYLLLDGKIAPPNDCNDIEPRWFIFNAS